MRCQAAGAAPLARANARVNDATELASRLAALFADPAQFPCLIWGYLDGYEGPQFQSQEAWSTDGVEYRVLLYFGTGAIDWRGVFHNPGA